MKPMTDNPISRHQACHHPKTTSGKHTVLVMALVTLLSAGCSTNFFSPHKVSVQQGNFVSQAMVNKLKPGMSKSQVRFVLGTPMIVDTFENDQWHYIYITGSGTDSTTTTRLQVVFSDDKLVEINGDFKPDAAE